MQISGKTRLLGLIGNPVEHTKSPAIHNSIASGEVYVPFLVEKGQLGEAVKGAYALNILGMNVTVPYKTDVIEYLKDIDLTAKGIGAVNTLVRIEGGYKGYNTDALGFGRSLENFGVEVKGKSVVMLGAGGAARAVAFQLCSMGIKDLMILNRSKEKADLLSDNLKLLYKDVNISTGLLADSEKFAKDFSINNPGEKYLAVQTTSVGLHPNEDECAVADGAFFDNIYAGVDIIYKPRETKFMSLCKAHGALAYNGERMLLLQGICAYELFTGKSVSNEMIEKAYRSMSAKTLILTGYMGTGKSTVGACLSKILHLPLFDTDALIEERESMSISEIFEKYGESAFRDMETKLLYEIRDYYGPCVLSLGGGMVLREKNREILSQIGEVYGLTALADTIYDRVKGDDNRPLLRCENPKAKIVEMLEARADAYKAASDYLVATDDKDPDAIALEIYTASCKEA